MREYDLLPAELRAWVATAILPWRAKSVRRAFDKAVARTGDTDLALRELDRIQNAMVSRDVQKVWGKQYPFGS